MRLWSWPPFPLFILFVPFGLCLHFCWQLWALQVRCPGPGAGLSPTPGTHGSCIPWMRLPLSQLQSEHEFHFSLPSRNLSLAVPDLLFTQSDKYVFSSSPFHF